MRLWRVSLVSSTCFSLTVRVLYLLCDVCFYLSGEVIFVYNVFSVFVTHFY
jgi:hypothetical protein